MEMVELLQLQKPRNGRNQEAPMDINEARSPGR
jgi:hypothetical protein